MNLKQKQILSTYFPELKDYKEAYTNPLLDSLIIGLINRIDTIKGEKGTDGKTPKKGEDYFTPQELREIITYIRDSSIPEEILRKATPVKGRDYRDGKDGQDGRPGPKGETGEMGLMGRPGKDGSPDSPLAIANKLNSLKGVLNPSVIEGVLTYKDLEVREKKISDGMARIDGRIKLIDQRWHGGGGSGSGGSKGFTKLTTTSTIDDSNKVFVFSDIPTYLIINGGWYDNTAGAPYTWTGTTTVTLNNVVGTGGAIWGFK